MRAMRLVRAGDPPVFELQELSDLEPGRDEVVIRLRAAALNARDSWVWTTPGYCPLPVTLGSDGAGVVAALGRDVSGLEVEQEVVFDPTLAWGDDEREASAAFDILGAPVDGTFAEQVVVPAANVVAKPARLSWEEAAALNLAGLTAWRATVTCGKVGEGTRVLVTGAGGGVSTFAVQIAAARGAHVLVTSGAEAKIERAVSLGAVAGASYRDPEWPERIVELAGGPLDVVVDGFGGPSWPGALRALRRGGTLVSFGDTSPEPATVPVVDVYWEWRRILGTSMGSPRDYRELLAHVESAAWPPAIDSVFALEQLAEAADRLGAPDRFGKVAIRIG